jgi:hypothetical protein
MPIDALDEKMRLITIGWEETERKVARQYYCGNLNMKLDLRKDTKVFKGSFGDYLSFAV